MVVGDAVIVGEGVIVGDADGDDEFVGANVMFKVLLLNDSVGDSVVLLLDDERISFVGGVVGDSAIILPVGIDVGGSVVRGDSVVG